MSVVCVEWVWCGLHRERIEMREENEIYLRNLFLNKTIICCYACRKTVNRDEYIGSRCIWAPWENENCFLFESSDVSVVSICQ